MKYEIRKMLNSHIDNIPDYYRGNFEAYYHYMIGMLDTLYLLNKINLSEHREWSEYLHTRLENELRRGD